MSVWKIKYVVYFNYLTVRREIGTKRKRALYFWRGLTLELNWSFLKGWKGWNFGGGFGPFKLQCGFSIFQFGPHNWVDLAPKIGAKSNPISMGPNWPQACTKLDSLVLAPFLGPKQHFTLYIPTLLHSFLPTPQPSCPYLLPCALSPSLLEYRPSSQSHSYTPAYVPSILKLNAHSCPTLLRSFTPYSTSPLTIIDQPAFPFACLVHFFSYLNQFFFSFNYEIWNLFVRNMLWCS